MQALDTSRSRWRRPAAVLSAAFAIAATVGAACAAHSRSPATSLPPPPSLEYPAAESSSAAGAPAEGTGMEPRRAGLRAGAVCVEPQRVTATARVSAVLLTARLDATALVAPAILADPVSDYQRVSRLRSAVLAAAEWDPDRVDAALAAAAVAPYAASVHAVESWWSKLCGTRPRTDTAVALEATGLSEGSARCVARQVMSLPDAGPAELTSALEDCGVDPDTLVP